MKVKQLINNNGNPVANHFIIRDDKGVKFLQSYDSIVVKRDTDGTVTLGADWDYSKTTLKYVKVFLGIYDSVKTIRRNIEYGHYKLDNSL